GSQGQYKTITGICLNVDAEVTKTILVDGMRIPMEDILKTKLLALIVVGTLLIGSMLFVHKPFSILSFIEDYSLYIFLPLQYILPLLLPIFLAIGKEKRKGKLENAIGKDNKEMNTQREIKTLSLEGKKEG
ncbi:MAG: hypothetical protein IKA39_04185, partial [Clostridia bacterium]|nr:hypothetical protein [Clostridia bacterium]